MNATKNSAALEIMVMNAGMNDGPEQDISSTLHFLLTMTTAGEPMDIVGNAGIGEGGLATSRRGD